MVLSSCLSVPSASSFSVVACGFTSWFTSLPHLILVDPIQMVLTPRCYGRRWSGWLQRLAHQGRCHASNLAYPFFPRSPQRHSRRDTGANQSRRRYVTSELACHFDLNCPKVYFSSCWRKSCMSNVEFTPFIVDSPFPLALPRNLSLKVCCCVALKPSTHVL